MRHRTGRSCLVAALVAALVAVPAASRPGAAQEPRAARIDSLESRVARLEETVEALREELRALREEGAREAAPRPGEEAAPGEAPPAGEEPPAAGEPPAGEEPPTEELEALREAARRTAREGAPPGAPDTAAVAASRTRDLQLLNPEISVTGDVVGQFTAPGGEENRFSAVPREFEFSFQSALDPYTRTKIFFTREEEFEIAGLEDALAGDEGDGAPEDEGEGGFEIEEAYMYWVGLPGGFGAKVGKFRQEIGLYNRWHNHALLEVERPLAPVTFLGEEGLIQTGASITFPSFQLGPATQTVWFEAARADNDLFDGGTEIAWLSRLQSFFDLGASGFFQVGVNGLVGENDEVGLDSRLFSVDLFYRWTPAGRSLYRDLGLKAEWYFAEQDFPGDDRSGNGGYVQANYRFDRRWVAGLRADYVDSFGDAPKVFQLVPAVTWWQSEWVRLRLQYNLLKPEEREASHTFLLQTVWSVGPHKHETY